MRRSRPAKSKVVLLAITTLLAVLATPAASRAATQPGGDIRDAARYYFMLSSARSNKCLSVADASTDDGARVIQETCDETAYNQHWSFFLTDDDYYVVVARHTDKCLTAARGRGPVVQQDCAAGNPDQQWTFPYVGGNNYLAVSRNSGRCLTVSGTGTAEGAAVVQRACVGIAGQQWRLGYY